MQKKISESKPLRDKTIIIVEDDQFISRLYTRWITLAGGNVIAAYNGMQGLEMLETHPVDMILLDLGLPGIDGYDTLVELRKRPHLKETPVIILTNTTIRKGSVEYEGIKKASVRGILQKYTVSLSEIVYNIQMNLEEKSVDFKT